MAISILSPITVSANVGHPPMLAINTMAEMTTASPGDEFEVTTTVTRLPAADPYGIDSGFVRMYYDTTRLEVVMRPNNRIVQPTPESLLHFSFGGLHNSMAGRVIVPVHSNGIPAYSGLEFSIRFRVRDNAPFGEALVRHCTAAGFAGIRIQSGQMHIVDMPFVPTNPNSDYARINIVEAPMLAIVTTSQTTTATPGTIIEVTTTGTMLPAASGIGILTGGIHIYYDVTRLRLVSTPVLVPPSQLEYRLLHGHQPSRVVILLDAMEWTYSLADFAFTIRFEVREDAPPGEAIVRHCTGLGFVGRCPITWNTYDMPIAPTNALTDYAYIVVVG